MAIETLGEAYSLGWTLTAKCAWGKRETMKSIRECTHSRQLDLATLLWTRGAEFPISMLASRLKCPKCGSRRITVIFDTPSNFNRLAGGQR